MWHNSLPVYLLIGAALVENKLKALTGIKAAWLLPDEDSVRP
jgi:hypothetical protein